MHTGSSIGHQAENLLLQGDHVLIADFGIARAIDLAIDEGITTQNLAVGTPRYMSPEQASGAAHLDGGAISTPWPAWLRDAGR